MQLRYGGESSAEGLRHNKNLKLAVNFYSGPLRKCIESRHDNLLPIAVTWWMAELRVWDLPHVLLFVRPAGAMLGGASPSFTSGDISWHAGCEISYRGSLGVTDLSLSCDTGYPAPPIQR